MATKYQIAALRYAENFEPSPDDKMTREERLAWVAAIEYARSVGEDDPCGRVEFAIFCDGRTDLDAAYDEWPGWCP